MIAKSMGVMAIVFLMCGDWIVAGGPVAGQVGLDELVVAEAGETDAIIVVSPEAGVTAMEGEGRQAKKRVVRRWERQAADDLAHYVALMTGARPAIAATREEIAAALDGAAPVLLVGEEALAARRGQLEEALARVAKRNPELRADAIAVQREGNRVYIAGTNEESHYYAVAWLLREWGCRWYTSTDFGECIPNHGRLAIGRLEHAYAPPFEVRNAAAGFAWLGDNTGKVEFQRRNFMNELSVPCGHSLGKYVEELVPEGKNVFNVPIAEPTTAAHVAAKAEADFAAGTSFSLGMNDGAYSSDSKIDAELAANLADKYFQGQALADNFMTLYNQVCRLLLAKYPESEARIGFFAYVNMTIPPQRQMIAESPLVAYLAPIDIDPNHGMDDPRSPPRQEYKSILYRWSEVMEGRVVIYDYDQGMLVWRDIPNPSHMAFREDVKHYRDAGILGLHTESRGAFATIFLNLYLRSQLMWDPDADVEALLDAFYPAFYGPAAEPMRRYWSAIYRAWEETIVTEHEFYTIPAIYTAPLVEELRAALGEAKAAVAELRARPGGALSRNEGLYLERMTFTEHGFVIIDKYTAMVRAAATDGDYATAIQAGEEALAARAALTAMNGIFTSTRMESGYAWFPGEVKQYRELLELTDGKRGQLVARLPLEWAFRRDPHDTGLARDYSRQTPDLSYWEANRERYATPEARKDYPITQWERVRSDLYPQAQGVLHPDWQSFTGFMWYKAEAELDAREANGALHVRFPGIFSEAWLYVNGYLVAHRPQHHMWWHNDYRFEWDVDLSRVVRPGRNELTIRIHNTHHNGGLFRRPFIYRQVVPQGNE